jgi:hypothetical protein
MGGTADRARPGLTHPEPGCRISLRAAGPRFRELEPVA